MFMHVVLVLCLMCGVAGDRHVVMTGRPCRDMPKLHIRYPEEVFGKKSNDYLFMYEGGFGMPFIHSFGEEFIPYPAEGIDTDPNYRPMFSLASKLRNHPSFIRTTGNKPGDTATVTCWSGTIFENMFTAAAGEYGSYQKRGEVKCLESGRWESFKRNADGCTFRSLIGRAWQSTTGSYPANDTGELVDAVAENALPHWSSLDMHKVSITQLEHKPWWMAELQLFEDILGYDMFLIYILFGHRSHKRGVFAINSSDLVYPDNVEVGFFQAVDADGDWLINANRPPDYINNCFHLKPKVADWTYQLMKCKCPEKDIKCRYVVIRAQSMSQLILNQVAVWGYVCPEGFTGEDCETYIGKGPYYAMVRDAITFGLGGGAGVVMCMVLPAILFLAQSILKKQSAGNQVKPKRTRSYLDDDCEGMLNDIQGLYADNHKDDAESTHKKDAEYTHEEIEISSVTSTK